MRVDKLILLMGGNGSEVHMCTSEILTPILWMSRQCNGNQIYESSCQ